MPSTIWAAPETYTFAMCPNPTGAAGAAGAAGEREYITPFRLYPVVREYLGEPVFAIVDDDDDVITCHWKLCGHVGHWKRIDIPAHEISLELKLVYNRALRHYDRRRLGQ